MLKLIKCEFLKLKRKKFIPLIILAAFLFPIPLTYLMTTPSMMERYTDQADAFDGLFNMVLGYGIQFFTWQAGRICFVWIGSCNLNGGIRYLMEWDLALICLREEIAFI